MNEQHVAKGNGLMARLERWFAENPDEELTQQDISVKFGVPMNSVHSRLWDRRGDTTIEQVKVVRLKATIKAKITGQR
jgi:hypothetical protein